MSKARFITLEGIEGAGKSTVARIARDWLTARGVKVCLTREPGGTPLAERVRELVLTKREEPLTPQVETLLMFAARGIHLHNLIRPALARGEWVICDRFTDATRAYQGAGSGVSREWIDELARAIHGDLEPDCTLLLDLPVAAGLARARQRSGAAPADRFEAEREPFFERVRAEYLNLARAYPSRIRVLDASAELGMVEREVAKILDSLLRAN